MQKRFQQLCAEPRTLKPLCKNLTFEKCAQCSAGVDLDQVGMELGPKHGKECDKFFPLDTTVESVDSKDESKKKSRKNKKKSFDYSKDRDDEKILEEDEENDS